MSRGPLLLKGTTARDATLLLLCCGSRAGALDGAVRAEDVFDLPDLAADAEEACDSLSESPSCSSSLSLASANQSEHFISAQSAFASAPMSRSPSESRASLPLGRFCAFAVPLLEAAFAPAEEGLMFAFAARALSSFTAGRGAEDAEAAADFLAPFASLADAGRADCWSFCCCGVFCFC